jgi:signal transduction histidine kinase
VLYRQWHTLAESRLLGGAGVVVSGLVGIGLFCLADLFVLWGLPLFISYPRVVSVMDDLHFSYSWGVMLVVTLSIFVGFSSLLQGMFVQTAKHREEVSRREQADAALSESGERFRALFQGLLYPNYVWQNRADEFFLIDYNRAAAALTERPIEQLKGKTLRQMVSILPLGAPEEIQRCFKSQQPIYREAVDRLLEPGVERNLAMSYAYVPPDLVLVQVEDITQRTQAEQERLMLDARLRQRQKLEAIGTLASGVAHEINNPINGIMNYAQLIDDRLDPESSLRQFAQGIGEETERVATIVRNLLTFSRHDEESHSPACVADLVNDTLSLVHAVIRKDQISLDVDVPRDLPLINCRSQQIQQAIMNLLTNARDALNQRYPEHDPDKIMKLTVRPFEKLERRWIRITVEDHGAGIADEIRDRVFDPFFTTKGRAEGTGLGLSISRSIVQDHHGELYVESKPGQQTRFQLELPVDNGYSRDGTPRQ